VARGTRVAGGVSTRLDDPGVQRFGGAWIASWRDEAAFADKSSGSPNINLTICGPKRYLPLENGRKSVNSTS